jgi:TonB family protein
MAEKDKLDAQIAAKERPQKRSADHNRSNSRCGRSAQPLSPMKNILRATLIVIVGLSAASIFIHRLNHVTDSSSLIALGVPYPSCPPICPSPSPNGDSRDPAAQEDTLAVVLTKVQPAYTDEAQRAGFRGDIHVSVDIDELGNVKSAKVINSPGLGLDEKVVAAVRQWKFKPAIKNGVAVASSATVMVTFK